MFILNTCKFFFGILNSIETLKFIFNINNIFLLAIFILYPYKIIVMEKNSGENYKKN